MSDLKITASVAAFSFIFKKKSLNDQPITDYMLKMNTSIGSPKLARLYITTVSLPTIRNQKPEL